MNKNWYKSKTIWASIFSAGVAVAAGIFGATNKYVVIAIGIGSALGIYGRFDVK